MPDINPVAVATCTVAAFILGGVYYAVFSDALAEARAGAAAEAAWWTYAVELLRCLVLATVVVGLVSLSGVTSVHGGLGVGLALWVGFPLVLWIGAIVHEGTPMPLAAIHAGDWLLKLLVLGAVAAALE